MQPAEQATSDLVPTEVASGSGSPVAIPTAEQSDAEEVYEECTAPEFGGDEEPDTELDELLAAEGNYKPEEPSPMSSSECQRLAGCVADLGMSISELDQAAEGAESIREVLDPIAHCYPLRWFAY